MSLQVSTAQYLAKVGVTTNPGTFGLHVDRPSGAVANTLTWTWPPGMLSALQSQTVLFWLLTLQRSIVVNGRPNSLVVYNVGTNVAPALDYRWTTIASWNYSQFQSDPVATGTVGYVDPWPTANGFAYYRLILNFAKPGDPVLPPYGELTWNVPISMPPYVLTAGPDGSGGTLLTWTAPQFFVPYITNWTHVGTNVCCSNPCDGAGCYRLDYNPASTPPMAISRYHVLKSTVDANSLAFATTINPPPSGPASWYDSDSAHNIWYRFQAVYPDGSLIDSNTIHASY